ncbi:DUF6455 family protein [Primorskyibacter aestuariivivens]|uniref:DUF6455 family protein n=1 Tax=Primorskyibacter aestuariivivens TaxID=1888912 RepID=UPI00230149C6|nr:DUF6455 family protein [Primorskyibacter aestuariivivens]MDA7429965.1 DUF6455 family protein [Primorskyibacter aestuariivivens]
MAAPLGDPALHFFITRGVARAMGLNLGDALRTGQLEPETYARMVTRCRGCARVGSCQVWLANSSVPHSSPPEQCPNAREFQSLQLH